MKGFFVKKLTSKFKLFLLSASISMLPCKLIATTIYDPNTNQLIIPLVKVGPDTYSNVVITVGSVLSVGGISNTQRIEGLWSGNTNTGLEINSLILENNEFWNIIGQTVNNFFYVVAFNYGATTITGSNFSNFYREFYSNNSVLGYASGTVVSNSAISGTATSVGTSIPQTISFSLKTANSTAYNYDKSADMNEVIGRWTGNFLSGSLASVQIANNGQVTGITNGCNFSGTIIPRNSGKNVFDISLIDGTGCPSPGYKSTGIAISYLLTSGKRQLIAAGTNLTKTQGQIFFAQR